MFSKTILSTIFVQHEELGEVSVVIQKLSGKSLEIAALNRQISVAPLFKAAGPRGSDLHEEIEKKKEAVVEKEIPNKPYKPEHNYNSYDRNTVLHQGIVKWGIPKGDFLMSAPTPEEIDDLDERTSEKLFYAIVDLSDPPKTEEELEQERKNA